MQKTLLLVLAVLVAPIESRAQPIALCASVEVCAPASACAADASIDAGSTGSNPVLAQAPAGPYALGTTLVTLQVSDGTGTAECLASVTVLDCTAPSVTCPSPITAECNLPFSADADPGPPSASDACSTPSTGVPERSIREGDPLVMTGTFDDYALDLWTATVDYGDGAGEETLAIEPDRSFYLSHTYADDGRFPLTVAVTDDSGAVGSDISEIIVRNVVPVVFAGPDAAIDEGQLFVSGGSFLDPGADTWTATVDYGDGSGAHPLAFAPDGTFALEHLYAFGGEFVVTVTVTDDDGGIGAGTAAISVRSVPPTVFLPGAISTDLAEGDTLVKSGSFTDPGLGPWTATVDYGDGTIAPLDLAPDGTFTLSHRYPDDGFFVVLVSVRDRLGATGTAMHQANVRNIAPIVSGGPDVRVDEEATLTINGQITDPGADTFVATLDWGDVGGVVPIDVAPDGSFTVSHVYTIHETYTVRITVFDDDGAFGTDEVHVTVDNLAPIVDLGIDALSTEGATFTQLVELADRDFDVIEARIDFGDASGLQFIDLGAGGGFFNLSHVYRDEGVYTLSVAVTDQDAAVTSRSIQVTVSGVAPAVFLSGAAQIAEGSNYFVSGNFTDPGLDTHVTTFDFGDGSGVHPATVRSGNIFDAVHLYPDNGSFTVSALVTDDDGLSGSASLALEVLNVAPAIFVDVPASIIRGETLSALGSFTDPGADVFTATVDYGEGAVPLALNPDKTFALSHTYGQLGTYTLRVTIADDDGGSASFERAITVSNIVCPSGLGDCDLDVANGCEASLATVDNCGACGHACSANHGAPSCSAAGVCAISCDVWFADCDGDVANGCEAAIGSGATCSGACPLGYSNCDGDATNGCEAGGLADCDGDLTNGCEASVAADPNSCGACGNVCAAGPNAVATCSSSQCGIACVAGFANCDGDATNGCETSGRCVCVPPFEDCDGDAANGCEVDLSSSADHCGSCGDACTFANASGACNAGSCELGACNSLFGDCNGDAADGCEVSLGHHAQNCGACGFTCPSGQACESGVCRSVLAEVCNGSDDDADGVIDDGLTVACNSACGSGVITCSGGRWGACSARRPAAEVCNGLDDDCDGIADDGIFPGCAFPNCSNLNGAPPALALTSPAADAVFGSAFEVHGSVTDTDLDSWIVDFLPAGGGTPIVLFTGSSPVSGGLLGRVQPALLPSGIGQLRLRALDCEGHVSVEDVAVRVESENLLGAVRITFEDLAVEVAGVPIQVTRTYDSRDRATSGDFGYGWSLSLATRSRMSRNIALGRDWAVVCGFFGTRSATELSGHIVEVRVSSARYRFRPVVTGLSPIGGGCTGTMSFQYVGGTGRASLLGSIFVFHDNNMPGHFRDDLGSPELADLQPVILALPDGRRFGLSAQGRIDSISDGAGNQVTITAGSISHSAGTGVSITRDGSGRVTRITDPSGAHLDYGYSAAGDLISVTDRASNTSTFEYAYDHNLERFDDAEGNTPMRVEHDADGRVGAFLDANQAPIAFAYDDLANRVAIDSPDGNSNEVIFDALGQPIGMESNGETTSMVYDAEGRLISDQRPLSGGTSREFDARGSVIREVDASGGVTTHDLTYSGDTIVRRVTTAPGGAITDREYDSAGRITRQVDPSGAISTMVYNAQGNLTRLAVDNDGRVEETTYGYDALGRLTSTTDALGRTTSSTLDALGRVTARTQTFTPAGGTPVSITTTIELDANGRPLGSTDPLGRINARTLDSRGRPTSLSGGRSGPQTFALDPNGVAMQMTNALGETFTSARDESGRLTSTVDESGVRFDLSYDAQGNLAAFGPAGLAPRLRSFDAAGRMTREESAGGDVTTFVYDAAGRQTEVHGSDGTVFKRGYDAAGRVSMREDALGRQTLYEYDTAGNLIRETAPGGAETLYGYDALGRRTSITDALGHITRFEYDAAGQRTKLIDQAGEEWRFEYDELGNLIRLIDPRGGTRVWERNAGGEVLREVFAGGAAITYEYDGAGRLTRQTNPGGDYVRFTYDAAGRLIEKAMSTGEVHTFTYGASGRQEVVTGPVGARSFVYDASGRAISMVLEDGTQVAYEYDASGRRTRMRWGTHDVRWEYDARERISRVHDESGTFAYTYDNAGMVTQLTRPNGTSSNYGYDIRDRVTLVEHRDPGGAIFDRATFTYDAIGRMTSATRSFGGVNVSYDFDYDPRGFLTLEQRNDGATIETIGYTYDAAGNRLTRVDSSGSITYVYDADDRLLSAGATTYGYDDAGRLISMTDGASSSSFDWSAGGELISATAGGVTETYDYDANGLRIRRTSGGVSTAAIWDDSAPGVPMLAGERAPSGDRANTWANGLLRSGDHFVHEDSRRNIDALSDAAGAVTAQLEYSAFGEPRSASPIPFGYRSELTDQLTGFQYLRARYYQPSIGRFISRDDIEINTRDAHTFARYAYGNNDPLMYSDPSGRFGFMGMSFSTGFSAGAMGIFWQVLRGLGYTAAIYCATDVTGFKNPSHGCTAGATAAKDKVFQFNLQPPAFPGATGRQQGIIGELFDWNKSVILPRIFPLLGGRMGWAGNTLSERFKCYCVNNRASYELQNYASSMGETLTGNMVGLGESEEDEHNIGHLRLDGTLEIWVDDWAPMVDPLSPAPPPDTDPTNTWLINPKLNCQTARL